MAPVQSSEPIQAPVRVPAARQPLGQGFENILPPVQGRIQPQRRERAGAHGAGGELPDVDQSRESALVNEIEEMIRPGAGLQVMQPGQVENQLAQLQTLNRDLSGPQTGEDILANLRQQLDEIQATAHV